MRFSYQRPLIS